MELNRMKIYLLDINEDMVIAWNKYFKNIENIEIINDSFESFMDKHKEVEAIVSPANAFGLMDGGYDKAIIDYFGKELMYSVQEKILLKWYGEQPVGTSMSIDIKNRIILDEKYSLLSKKYAILIHTPTMRTPEPIIDSRIIYQCMRTTLIEAMHNEVESIVIPAFGGLTGKVNYDRIARLMFLAYTQLSDKTEEINWVYAYNIASNLSR